DRTSKRRWQNSCLTSQLKSSSAPIMPKDLWCCHAVGSSSAPLLGSTAAESSAKIGRTSTARRSPSYASPQSASCSENFVIPLDVPGRTLRSRRENQCHDDQRHDPDQETQRQHAERAPAPAAMFALSRLRRNAVDVIWIFLERALPLDQAPRDIVGHRPDDIGNVMRLGKH